MSEIRSTLELVMERAARLEAQADDALEKTAREEDGMRLAAAFMAGKDVDFSAAMAAGSQDDLRLILQGAITAFMRNIVLPRGEEASESSDKAMQGLLQLGQSPEVLASLGEIKKILEQYNQHRQQLKEQLEMQFAQQMGQLEENLAQQTGMKMQLKPSQHPQFAEEWQKVTSQLNDQYGQALEQHKAFIEQQILAG